jgi:hypothetical protein
MFKAGKCSNFLHDSLELILASKLQLFKSPLAEWDFLHRVVLPVDVVGDVVYFAEGSAAQYLELLKFNGIS